MAIKAIGFKVVRILPDGRAESVSDVHSDEDSAVRIARGLREIATRDFFRRESYEVVPALARVA